MAEDKIDIEEHDILDNPVIRRIFPDISIIKKEVLDYNDEGVIGETSVHDIGQKSTEKCPAAEMEKAYVTLPYSPSKRLGNVVDANFTKGTEIYKGEKYPTILNDEADVTLPSFSKNPSGQVLEETITEMICLEVEEGKKYPTIVIDDPNETSSCFLSKVADKVIESPLTRNNLKKKINKPKRYPTIVVDETSKQTLPTFSSKPASQVLRSKFSKKRIDKAKKYPTVVGDESNVTVSCFFNKLAEQGSYGAKLTENNLKQTNKRNIDFQSSKNLATDKKIASKFEESNVPQIDEVENDLTMVTDTCDVTFPNHLNEAADKEFNTKVSQTDEIYNDYGTRFVNKTTITQYNNTQKNHKDLIVSVSELLPFSRDVTSNINVREGNKNNANLNHSRQPKSFQKKVVLPKEKSKHSINSDANLPECSKLSENRDPLTLVSCAKSSPHCEDNFQSHQNGWIGNKIVLGSKSSTANSQNKQNISTNVRVLVENVSTFLSKSTRYCKTCLILFPSNKTLSDHRNLVHSQFSNKELSMSSKIIKKSMNLKRKHKCNICGALISSLSNLIRHKRRIHSLQIKKKKRRSNLNSDMQPQPNGKLCDETNFKCTHCNESFSSQKVLIDHMYNVLQSNTNKNVIKSTDNVNLKREEKHKDSRLFHRCPICSYYFILKYNYVKHLKNNHKKVAAIKLEKVLFDPVCKYCSNKYSSANSFNFHIWNHHGKLRKLVRHPSKIKDEKSRIILKSKEHTLSNLNNNRNDVSNNEVNHLENKDKIMCTKYLLKSVFFKCAKCSLCFLTAKEAANHIKHKDTVRNWKCSKCSQIFMTEEQTQHDQQHLLCDNFEVFEISEITYKYILFKCPNCSSYFDEEDFFYHYSLCEMQPPDSAYCKTCHILIDNKIKELHDVHHKMVGGKKLENILVETDVITLNHVDNKEKQLLDFPKESEDGQLACISQNNTDDKVYEKFNITYKELEEEDIFSVKRKKKNTGQLLKFLHCGTCKTFIYVNRVRKLYNHIKGRCLNLPNSVCKYCGLVLLSKTIDSHRKLHQNLPNITLNDLVFHDLKTGKKICPPVPKYPSCHLCEKHFITKTAIMSHCCSEDNLKCPICNIKLSKTAFPLHMSFHNYSIKRKSEISSVDLSVCLKDSHPISVTNFTGVIDSNKDSEDRYLLVYICKICKVAVDTYDSVIEHCQYHISNQEKELFTKPCDLCNLIFDDACINNHKILHSHSQNKKFSVLTYDAFYVTAEDKLWLNHLFGSLSKKEINNILKHSIYSFERRIKMRIVQDGLLPELTFFKCAKCNGYIDPLTLYEHCRMDVLCYKSKLVPCPTCGVLLVSDEFLLKHQKIHETKNVTERSYRIVLFNCIDDKDINRNLSLPRQYVVYECRNCNGVVDNKQFQYHKCDFEDLSKCSHCGLLLYKNDYMPHVVKHKEFCSFHESNITVILLGAVKDTGRPKSRYRPSFNGQIIDYLVYKCSKCQVCLKDQQTSRMHDCAKDLAKTKCVPCDLYFEDNFFRKHRKLHEYDSYFAKENLTVVESGLEYPREINEHIIVIEDEDDLQNKDSSIIDNKLNFNSANTSKGNNFPPGTVVEKYDDIFKCTCDLYFLTEASALSHYNLKKCNIVGNNQKVLKQTCSKCDLIFEPNILYSHLLKHHGSKQVSYKFNIIPISKKL